MEYSPINLQEKFTLFQENWSPKVVGQLNDYHLKIARIEGEFIWHSHQETDELFMLVDGHLKIEFRDGEVELKPGDFYIVPKGVEHKPVAIRPCKILMIEPAGTLNTGDSGGERTVESPEWV